MQLAFKFDDWTCPLCGQDTKPDWWSEDGYSCMDCGPVLEVEYEEPPLINFYRLIPGLVGGCTASICARARVS